MVGGIHAFFSGAQEGVAGGDLLSVVREILPGEEGKWLGVDALIPKEFGGDFFGEGRRPRIVDEDGIALFVLSFPFAAAGLGDVSNTILNPRRYFSSESLIESANRSTHFDQIGDDIVCAFPSLETADAEHGGAQRTGSPGDQLLEGADHMGARDDGIPHEMGHGCVPSLALNLDPEIVG